MSANGQSIPLLSNSTKVHLLDPEVNNNSRTTFRLPDGYLSSSFKLIDLGVYNTNLDDTSGQYYPSILGVLASIKKLTLKADSVDLDEAQELGALGSVEHLRTTNQGSEDINRFELHNGANLSISRTGSYTVNPVRKDYYDHTSDAVPIQRALNQFQISATSTGNSGSITIADYLGFLQSVTVLPNLPNLRLLIEWNTTASDYYEDPSATAKAKAYIPLRPTLVVEEFIGQQPEVKNLKLPYISTLVERVTVPPVADGVKQTVSFRSGAFKSRYLKDIMFFNKVTTADGFMLAKQRSPAMYKEILQLVINGRKYLPDQGINQEAMKIQYFNDTYGALNLPQFAYLPSLVDASGKVLDTPTEPLKNNFSVTGVTVEVPIERMDVEYNRTGNNQDASQIGSFDLLMFGRVARLLEMTNGKIRISS